MPFSFWLKRFLFVFSGVFAVLLLVALVRGRSLGQSASESALWSAITTVIFILTRLYRSRQGQHCELCRDTPEMREDKACELAPDARKAP